MIKWREGREPMKRVKRAAVLLVLFAFIAGGCVKKEIQSTATEKGKLVLYNGVIIDGTGTDPMENMRIYLSDGKITDITPDGEEEFFPGYTPIDLKGYTVLPGFINTHVHSFYSEAQLESWLKNGVTTVRELASVVGSDFAGRRDTVNAKNQLARIVVASPMLTKPGGYTPPCDAPVASADEAAQKTNEFLDQKADVIKIAIEDNLQMKTWNMLSVEEIRSITKTTHERGKWVAAHISHVKNLPLAVQGDVDELSHMVVEPMDQEIISQIVEEGIYWVPTLELWKGVSQLHNLDWDTVAVENLSNFYSAGGLVALGTDYGGYMVEFDRGMPMTEIELMKEAGMTNMDIIVSATRNAAVVCDMEETLGTLQAGRIADIIVVRENPLEDLKALESLSMVIHNGEIVVTN
jgi:imidazolonepropionase-like amidohydrolase